MGILQKTVGFLKRHGPEHVKHGIWNLEYKRGQWDYLGNRAASSGERDPVYSILEKYGYDGGILDLGCGTGSTALEMARICREYVGVDLSEQAIQHATAAVDRVPSCRAKCRFFVADIATYVAKQRFAVVLFNESIYYLGRHHVQKALARYASSLHEGGVFVIRVWNRQKHRGILDVIERELAVVEKYAPDSSDTAIIVGSPRSMPRASD
jgi:SAM-dependent methyltransferase